MIWLSLILLQKDNVLYQTQEYISNVYLICTSEGLKFVKRRPNNSLMAVKVLEIKLNTYLSYLKLNPNLLGFNFILFFLSFFVFYSFLNSYFKEK